MCDQNPHHQLTDPFVVQPFFSPAYVDEHVEARYEEIINHLHKALSSTEEDELDFKVKMCILALFWRTFRALKMVRWP